MTFSHATAFAGGSGDLPALLAFLASNGISTSGNPDLYVRCYGAFGVDNAREIAERAALRALGERRVFVLAVDAINAEAQNALLKTLEEPPGGAMFFILHPSPETLLPTMRSRLQLMALPDKAVTAPALDAEAFLAAAPAARLTMLQPLLGKEGSAGRDMGAIISFLSSLERVLARQTNASGSIRALYRARRYLGDRGALVKPLLEQLALLV